jgi:hypothetical protein
MESRYSYNLFFHFWHRPKNETKRSSAALRNSVPLLKVESVSDFSATLQTSSTFNTFQFALLFANAKRILILTSI